MGKLEAVATANLWGTSFWDTRRQILMNEFSSHKLTAEHSVILAFQEVSKSVQYPLLELAEGLGFSKQHVHFFPTIISGEFGLGVITNLEVVKKHFVFFTHDRTDPLEFGERGIVLLAIKGAEKLIVVGVTHLSVSEQAQYIHAFEALHAVQQFSANVLGLKEEERKKYLSGPLSLLQNKAKILIAGDFNAAPALPLYELFRQSGLNDYTLPLHKRHQYSWPTDPQWLIDIHKKTFGRQPPFDVVKLQRWIDYIWGCGFAPKGQTLLGIHPENNMYASDHLIPVVYF